MLLAEAREQRGDETDADAAAQIAHERGESADLVVFLLRNAGVAKRVDRNKQERQAQRDDDAPADGHAKADVEIDDVMRQSPKVVMTKPMATSLRGSNLGASAPATGKRNISTSPPEETAMPAWRAE